MKIVKKILLSIIILVGIILFDSVQALVFDNSPILKIREYYDGETINSKDKGLFVDTYNCLNGKKDTQLKGFSYSCDLDSNITIIDKSKSIENFACDTALDLFYEDENYYYSYECIKSDYVIVRYSDGTEETVKEALKNKRFDIGYLDKFNIYYIKQDK